MSKLLAYTIDDTLHWTETFSLLVVPDDLLDPRQLKAWQLL